MFRPGGFKGFFDLSAPRISEAAGKALREVFELEDVANFPDLVVNADVDASVTASAIQGYGCCDGGPVVHAQQERFDQTVKIISTNVLPIDIAVVHPHVLSCPRTVGNLPLAGALLSGLGWMQGTGSNARPLLARSSDQERNGQSLDARKVIEIVP